MTHTNTEAVSDVFAVLMNGNWSIATRVSASAYGEDTGEQVWSEQGTTAWIGLVGKEDASIALSRRAANSAGGVEVKALEWAGGVYEFSVSDPIGYAIEKGAKHYRLYVHKGTYLGAFDSVEEAKAAAQADFNQRILSALTHPSSPVSAEVTEEVVMPQEPTP